jgi:hypothetical protein
MGYLPINFDYDIFVDLISHKNEDVRYWMILVDGKEAGVINLTGLTNPEGNLGWAYYVGEKSLRSIMTALSLEMSMFDYIFLCF